MSVNEAVRKVLREAADTPHFFDLSDAERLVGMLGMAFELGQKRAANGNHAGGAVAAARRRARRASAR
jgi:hypothetical protein